MIIISTLVSLIYQAVFRSDLEDRVDNSTIKGAEYISKIFIIFGRIIVIVASFFGIIIALSTLLSIITPQLNGQLPIT